MSCCAGSRVRRAGEASCGDAQASRTRLRCGRRDGPCGRRRASWRAKENAFRRALDPRFSQEGALETTRPERPCRAARVEAFGMSGRTHAIFLAFASVVPRIGGRWLGSTTRKVPDIEKCWRRSRGCSRDGGTPSLPSRHRAGARGPNAEGLIPAFSLIENVALHGLGRRRGLMPWAELAERTAALLTRFGIVAQSPKSAAGTLSGGNQQRLIIARELEHEVDLVVADNPTRGLDLRATAFVHDRLREAAGRGAVVVSIR